MNFDGVWKGIIHRTGNSINDIYADQYLITSNPLGEEGIYSALDDYIDLEAELQALLEEYTGTECVLGIVFSFKLHDASYNTEYGREYDIDVEIVDKEIKPCDNWKHLKEVYEGVIKPERGCYNSDENMFQLDEG